MTGRVKLRRKSRKLAAFEYMTATETISHDYPGYSQTIDLNEYGRAGWQLVSVARHTQTGPMRHHYRYFFMRPSARAAITKGG